METVPVAATVVWAVTEARAAAAVTVAVALGARMACPAWCCWVAR